jgi:predicted amino acid racemase
MAGAATPCVSIDLAKIEHNARVVVDLCAAHGITVAGVTKGVCGHPGVARAMLRGGVASIADSRLPNLQRLQRAGIGHCTLLRLPALDSAGEVVALAGMSLNSELAVLAALSRAAGAAGRLHDVMLMVELGDLREGILPRDLGPFLSEAVSLPGLRIRGLGTNLSCFAGVVPDAVNMGRLVELAAETEAVLGAPLEWISGANSSALDLIAAGGMPAGINHARMGEAILLGRETVRRRPWPGTFQDAFVLHAQVLERKRKPSLPAGQRGEDAFGGFPRFEDRGERVRALLDVGREDVMVEGLTPLLPGVRLLGATSGYLVADVTDAPEPVQVGSRLAFGLGYGALLAAMSSRFVRKTPGGG